MKKLTSVLLALVMIFALAIPAFATKANQKSLAVAGEMVAPTITVTMPTGVVLGLNPYKMKYAGATAFLKNEKGSQDQILSPMAIIENKTDCKLNVDVAVTATGSKDIVFKKVDTALDTAVSDVIAKNVYLEVQIGEAKDKTSGAFKEGTTPGKAVLQPDDDNPYKATANYSSANTSDTVADGKMKTIELGETDGKVANYLGIQFGGKASTKPTTAWTSADKVDVALVFTFNPVVLDVASSSTGSGTGGT